MSKLLSRDEYYENNQGKLKKKCPFCHSEQIILLETKFFSWIAALSPYFEYQTMIVPKRHVVKPTELSQEEKAELDNLVDKIGKIYRDTDIRWKDTGERIENIIYFWRNRAKLVNEKIQSINLEHYHLHIIPDRDHMLDPIEQKDAYKWDYTVFTEEDHE